MPLPRPRFRPVPERTVAPATPAKEAEVLVAPEDKPPPVKKTPSPRPRGRGKKFNGSEPAISLHQWEVDSSRIKHDLQL